MCIYMTALPVPIPRSHRHNNQAAFSNSGPPSPPPASRRASPSIYLKMSYLKIFASPPASRRASPSVSHWPPTPPPSCLVAYVELVAYS